MNKLSSGLLRVQGFYLLLSSVFVIITIERFASKPTDVVPVYIYSIVLVCAAISFIDSTRHNRLEPLMSFVPFFFAAGLLCVDVYGVFNNMLPKIYLADAYAQGIFLYAWVDLFVRAIKLRIKKKNEMTFYKGSKQTDITAQVAEGKSPGNNNFRSPSA